MSQKRVKVWSVGNDVETPSGKRLVWQYKIQDKKPREGDVVNRCYEMYHNREGYWFWGPNGRAHEDGWYGPYPTIEECSRKQRAWYKDYYGAY